MNLALDDQTQLRIQREIDRGHFREPAEVIAHALDLLESQEDWLLRNREAISERLEESIAQAQRGEVFTLDDAARLLDEKIAAHVSSRAQ